MLSKAENKQRNRRYWLIYTILFAALAAVLFAPFWSTGRTLVWKQDGVYQHYNAFIYLGSWVRQIIRTLLTEHRLVIPMWEFSIGYGADIFTTLIYYVFGDPFSLLSVFTPVKYADVGYSVAILLRFFVSGIAFSLYVRKLGARKDAALLSSLMYAFCAYALYSGIRHPFFLNPMVNLPLVFLGVEKIFKKEKPWAYSLAVCISAVSNFYFFYMIVLLTVFYVAVRVLTDGEKRKNILRYLVVFAGYALLGILMAAVLFLPMVMNFLQNSRAGEVQKYSLFYNRAEYEAFIGSFVSCRSGMHWAYVGVTPFALIGTILLFLQKKHYQWLKILLGCSFAGFLFPIVGHVMNGFGYVTNRWSFFWPFLVCTAFALIYPLFANWKRREKVIVSVICGTYVLACLVLEKADTRETMTGGMLLIIALLYSMLMKHLRLRMRKISAGEQQLIVSMGLVCVSVLVLGGSVYDVHGGNYAAEFLKRKEAYDVLYKERASYWTAIKDDGFYRIDNAAEDNAQKNFALTTGQTTTSFYWSVVDAGFAQYMMENSAFTGTSYTFKTLLSRSLMLPLAGAKYYVAGDTKAQLASVPYGYESIEKDGKPTGVYASSLALPLGYTYDAVISRTAYEQLPLIQKQQAMLQGAVVDENDSKTIRNLPEAEAVYADQNIPYTIVEADGAKVEQNTIITDKDKASVTLQFEPVADGEVYVQLLNLHFQSTSKYEGMTEEDLLQLSDKKRKKAEKALKYWTPQTETKIIAASGDMQTGDYHYESKSAHTVGRRDYLLNLAYSEGERKQIKLTFTKRGTYTFDTLQVLFQPVRQIDEQISNLRQDVLEQEQITTNSITGRITLKKTKLLCLSVPYGKGWTLYVDGKEAELLKVNTMYMGAVLEKGTHTIELKYCTPYIKTGLVVSLLGCLIWILGCFFGKKRKK